MSTALKIHSFCSIFPETSPEEYEQLKKSIQEHGQRDAIVLLGQEILDGRTRYKATRELKINPVMRQYDPVKDGPDPLAWVIDKNLHRRHLTVGQRAALGASLEKVIAEDRKQKAEANKAPAKVTPGAENVTDFPTPERARAEAAKEVGVSEGSIAKAKQLQQTAPDKFEEVKKGVKTLDQASKEAKKEQREKDKDKAPLLGGMPAPIPAARREASDHIRVNHGDKFGDAVLHSTILKDRELGEFMKLAIVDQKQIAPLVANGWKVKQAVKFAKGIFEQDDTLREVLNLALMRKGPAVIKLAGHHLVMIPDAQLPDLGGRSVRLLIEDTLKAQAKPQAEHSKLDNSVGKALDKASPLAKKAAKEATGKKPTTPASSTGSPAGASSRASAGTAGKAKPGKPAGAAVAKPGKPAVKRGRPPGKKAAGTAPKAPRAAKKTTTKKTK